MIKKSFCCVLCGCIVKEGEYTNEEGIIKHIDSCISYYKENE